LDFSGTILNGAFDVYRDSPNCRIKIIDKIVNEKVNVKDFEEIL